MKRSTFLQYMAGGVAGLYFTKCTTKKETYSVLLVNDNAAAGHLLQNIPNNIQATENNSTDVFIIGGGVAGLSAARWLSKTTTQSITIAELANVVGGNASAGQNEVCKYPWAAHYLPLPNNSNQALLQFLQEASIIQGYQNSLPIYDERFLCHEPKERLYVNGFWQEGIVPNQFLSKQEKNEIQKFLQYTEVLKNTKGNDGKFVFDIPLQNSSTDKKYTDLEKISFSYWLTQEGYIGKALLWFVNYCTSDDYGASITQVSAWAGLHYFCARRASAYNAKPSEVLTWPEGNTYLVEKLIAQTNASILTNEVVLQAKYANSSWTIKHYNTITKKYSATQCKSVICAVPLRVADKIFPETISANILSNLQHYPWVNANITLKKNKLETNGAALSWDNVIYGSKCLGYVKATHQILENTTKDVITVYFPINNKSAKEERNALRQMKEADLQKIIMNELKKAHPQIETFIEKMEIKLLGHGMVAPSPNYIFNEDRLSLQGYKKNNLVFAHTDIIGISIFEEAFAIGIAAAQKIT